MSKIEHRRASQFGAAGGSSPKIQTAGDGGIVFSGVVVRWDSLSEDLGGFREVVKRGAFSKVLGSPRSVPLVLDHDKAVLKVLASTKAGTLHLAETDEGLVFVANAGDTQAARDAAIVVRRNPIGVSFAFVAGKQNWSRLPDGTRRREIAEVSMLDEISLVVDPAYKSSSVSVVSAPAARSAPHRPLPDLRRQRAEYDFMRRQLQLAEADVRTGELLR